MAMTTAEPDTRATRRAIDERLHTFKVTGQPVYLVRSRQTEPGSMREVRRSTPARFARWSRWCTETQTQRGISRMTCRGPSH